MVSVCFQSQLGSGTGKPPHRKPTAYLLVIPQAGGCLLPANLHTHIHGGGAAGDWAWWYFSGLMGETGAEYVLAQNGTSSH